MKTLEAILDQLGQAICDLIRAQLSSFGSLPQYRLIVNQIRTNVTPAWFPNASVTGVAIGNGANDFGTQQSATVNVPLLLTNLFQYKGGPRTSHVRRYGSQI